MADDVITEWLRYIDTIKRTLSYGYLVEQLWKEILNHNIILPPPQTGPLPSEPGFEFAWDIADHHLDIVYYENGYEWFYRNRRTEKITGKDVLTKSLTQELVSYLKMFDHLFKLKSLL